MSGLIDDASRNEITGCWDYASLPKNVTVGRDCFLERKDSFKRCRSTQDHGLILGDRVKVYTWTEFNIEPGGSVEVGDDSILAGAIFMCAQSVRIGRRVVVSYNVTIADSDFHPRDPDLRRLDAIANAPHGNRAERPAIVTMPVVIEDDVWVGIGAIILKGVRLGRGARIGAGAVITSDVEEGVTVSGNPAKVVDGSLAI